MARRLGWVVVAAVVVAVGVWATAPMRSGPEPRPATSSSPSVARTGAFVCPMHPQITSDDPAARCPLCGMKLVRVRAGTRPAPTDEREATPGASDELRAVGFVTRDPGGGAGVRVVADVAPVHATRLAVGQPARLDIGALPGRSFAGEVLSVEPVSAETGAARVWLTFAGAGLEPGQYGDLRIGTVDRGVAGRPGAPPPH